MSVARSAVQLMHGGCEAQTCLVALRFNGLALSAPQPANLFRPRFQNLLSPRIVFMYVCFQLTFPAHVQAVGGHREREVQHDYTTSHLSTMFENAQDVSRVGEGPNLVAKARGDSRGSGFAFSHLGTPPTQFGGQSLLGGPEISFCATIDIRS